MIALLLVALMSLAGAIDLTISDVVTLYNALGEKK